MSTIKPGQYSVKEVLDLAGFDFIEKAAADYNQGEPDYRRVKIGGLSFDALDDIFVIPDSTDSLEITLDGKVDIKLDVK